MTKSTKMFFLGVGFTLVAVFLMAADGGYSMNWKRELSQASNQKVLFDSIQQHCRITESEHIVPTNGSKPYDTQATINCYTYDEK